MHTKSSFNTAINQYYKGNSVGTVCIVPNTCIVKSTLDRRIYERMNLPVFNMLANKLANAPLFPHIPLILATHAEIKEALNVAYQIP